jgi:phage gp46-like protein
MDKVFSTDRTHLCMVERVNDETGYQIGTSTLEGWNNWRLKSHLHQATTMKQFFDILSNADLYAEQSLKNFFKKSEA